MAARGAVGHVALVIRLARLLVRVSHGDAHLESDVAVHAPPVLDGLSGIVALLRYRHRGRRGESKLVMELHRVGRGASRSHDAW